MVELFAGSFGWSQGFLEEGFHCVGFDILHESYHGPVPEGADIVLQDVRTLHGSQFKEAVIICASPPCQAYSWMAMPWSRGKKMAEEIRNDYFKYSALNELFVECFRIQWEACEAAGRYIPLIVENVRGAQPWVGKAKWNYGSFYLWGDVPALMPFSNRGAKVSMPGDDSLRIGFQQNAALRYRDALKVPGMNFHDHEKGQPGRSFQTAAVATMDTFGWSKESELRRNSSSSSRKAASAQIAKIPLALSRHIARVFKPQELHG